MDASTPSQVFVRTSNNEVMGPLTVGTLKLFIENDAFSGMVELSVDGERFATPGEFPSLRSLFPKKMWGNTPAVSPAAREIPAEGQLQGFSPIRLYALAAAQEKSGLLRLNVTDREILIHFRKGNADVVSSSHADDSLGNFLLKNNLLTSDQLARTESAKSSFGGDLLPALFGLGMLNPATAFGQLAQHAKGVLLRAFAATTGKFTFESAEFPANRALPLGDRWEVLMEQLRKFPAPALEKRLAPFREAVPEKSVSLVPFEKLRLTSIELRVAGYFDGTRSLSQVLASHSAETEGVLRMAYTLKELGGLSYPEPAVEAPRPVAPAPRPPVAAPPVKPAVQSVPTPAARPAVAAAAPAPAAEAIEKLQKLKEKQDKQNHFEVLGLAPTADAAAVKAAYFKGAKQYHPDTVTGDAPREIAALKAAMFARLGEAYRVLSDETARAEYEETLRNGSSPQLNVAQVMAAEEMFQKASILVKARKYADAICMLDEALAANPAEGEFFIWRGYARFFTVPDRAQAKAQALEDIQRGLGLNERCVAGFYFQGVIAKLMGELAQAKQFFQKCLQLQPEHLDAQRELRAMK